MESLKREIKGWESSFRLQHGRRPAKDDVTSAPEEIQEAYKRYHKLKQANNPHVQDCMDIKSSVFGKGLNKTKTAKTKPPPLKAVTWKGVTLARPSHGNGPKKSALQGVQHENNHETFNITSEKVTTTDLSLDETGQLTCSITSNIDRTSAASFMSPLAVHTKKTEVLSSRLKRMKSASLKWLDRAKFDPPSFVPIHGQRKLSDVVAQGETENYTSGGKECERTIQKNKEGCSFSTGDVSLERKRVCCRKSTSESKVSWEMKNLIISPEHNESLKVNIQSSSQGDVPPTRAELPAIPKMDDTRDILQSSSQRIATVVQETNCELDKVQALSNERQDVGERDTPRKKRKFAGSAESASATKLPKLSTNGGTERPIENAEDVPSSRKSSSGLISDNFRRLDMKHRHYKRRGGGMSGSMHKRRKWREMMKSRGENNCPSGKWGRAGAGSGKNLDVCYKCGEEGHWAKNCYRQKRSKARGRCQDESSLNVDEEKWVEFPSIDEAAMMAVGIPLVQINEAGERGKKVDVILPHELPRSVYEPPTPPSSVEPLYQAVNGQATAAPKDVFMALKKLGFSSFRAGQEGAVMRILCGLSSLVVLSTGAGKSLCYQLPAFLYAKSKSPCVTLVISPLVSLMEDQVASLPPCLKGACLHTNMSKVQREKVVQDLCSGKVTVLLLSPEALVSGKGYLPSATNLPPVAFACIDEAHCLSEWSHNFRPSYLRVCKVLRERFGVRCFLGLTATATLSTAASAAEHLGIVPDDNAIVTGVAVPPNLNLSVSVDDYRDKALVELFKSNRFSQCDSIIIYCTRRDETERVASMLRICLQNVPKPPKMVQAAEEVGISRKNQKGQRTKRKKTQSTWSVESYHAGMTAAHRRRVQAHFMSGELAVVVATVAFGMGLDKSDVRAIIHYNMPKTFEGYVQEIGRAGRDGLPAYCHVFLDPEGKDVCELRRHVYANTVDRVTVKKLVKQVFPYCKCTELHKLQQERKECHMAAAALISDEHKMMEYESVRSTDGDEPGDDVTQLNHPKDEQIGRNENESGTSVTDTEATEAFVEQSFNDRDGLISSSRSVEPPIGNNQNDSGLKDEKGRCCGGHDVALVTDDLVDALDMSKENILTLLCYLELSPNRLIEVLEPIKSTCTLQFYGGVSQLRRAAQKVPVVAAAVAINAGKSAKMAMSNTLEFSVVEVADQMGWDLDPVCKELRALQWNTSLAVDTSDASLGRSGVLVEFSDVSFHIRSPGDLSAEQRDKVCNFLEGRILAEERGQLEKLNTIYSSLKKVSCGNFWRCTDEACMDSDLELKQIIQSYFEDPTEQCEIKLEKVRHAKEHATSNPGTPLDIDVNWELIGRDIRTFVAIHHDHSFTGRNMARIFHGIESPCYPAAVWGRERRFWRKHLDVDFNALRKFATKELLKLRK